MGKINSRTKGAAGEREAAKFIADTLGIVARRGQQFSGSVDSPDIVTELSGVHFEVKRVQSLNLEKAYEQACRDAGTNKVPVVMHRKDRKEWMFTFAAKDVIKFVQEIANRDETTL